MGINSKIEWTENTMNPWIGCARISPACDHCYAADLSARTFKVKWGAGEARKRTSESYWKQPLKWDAEAAKAGVRTRVFCASLADVFDNEVPVQWRVDLLYLIDRTPNLDWMLLTKRIGNAQKMLDEAKSYIGTFAVNTPNVHLGITICNQAEADRDIPKLLATSAAKRFLSIEPMLGPIDLNLGYRNDIWREDSSGRPLPLRKIDLVIAGGESGPHARPSHPDWFRSLSDQCAAANVPFMFKQWGEWCPRGPESMGYASVEGVKRIRLTDAGYNGSDLASDGDNHVWMNRAGKRVAGRLLDGVEHNGRIAL